MCLCVCVFIVAVCLAHPCSHPSISQSICWLHTFLLRQTHIHPATQRLHFHLLLSKNLSCLLFTFFLLSVCCVNTFPKGQGTPHHTTAPLHHCTTVPLDTDCRLTWYLHDVLWACKWGKNCSYNFWPKTKRKRNVNDTKCCLAVPLSRSSAVSLSTVRSAIQYLPKVITKATRKNIHSRSSAFSIIRLVYLSKHLSISLSSDQAHFLMGAIIRASAERGVGTCFDRHRVRRRLWLQFRLNLDTL